MRVVIYARESSKDTKIAPPIQEQIKRGKDWVEKNQYTLIREYVDNGYSGGDWNRPAWNQLIRDARKLNRDFDCIWTWSQDRLARDTEQFLYFARNLRGKVQVICEVEGPLDMETLGGRLKHTQLAVASETFRLITSEKVRRAYLSQKEKAEKTGQPLNWGRKAREIDMEKVKKLKEEGYGWRRIAKELGGNISHVTIKNRWELSLLMKTKNDLAWLRENYDQVLKEHNNEYVAIKERNIVASNRRMDDLLNELKNKGIDPSTTLVQYINKGIDPTQKKL